MDSSTKAILVSIGSVILFLGYMLKARSSRASSALLSIGAAVILGTLGIYYLL